MLVWFMRYKLFLHKCAILKNDDRENYNTIISTAIAKIKKKIMRRGRPNRLRMRLHIGYT